MCVCVYVCIYIYIYIYTYIYIYHHHHHHHHHHDHHHTQGATAASVQSALEANTNQHQAHRRARTAPLAPTRQWHPQPRVLVCALRVPPTPSRLLVCMHICLICMLVYYLVCTNICHKSSVSVCCVWVCVLHACVRACSCGTRDTRHTHGDT